MPVEAPSRFVLEVPGGWSKANGVSSGMPVTFQRGQLRRGPPRGLTRSPCFRRSPIGGFENPLVGEHLRYPDVKGAERERIYELHVESDADDLGAKRVAEEAVVEPSLGLSATFDVEPKARTRSRLARRPKSLERRSMVQGGHGNQG